MIQSCRELDLPQEPVGAETRRQLRMKNLQRDESLVLCILREIHGRHPAAAELAIYGVVLLECFLDSVERCALHPVCRLRFPIADLPVAVCYMACESA